MDLMHDHINPYDGRLVCAADAHGRIVFSAPMIGQENTREKTEKEDNNDAKRERTGGTGGRPSRALHTLQRIKERIPN